jgi:hypothetical protein
LKAAGVVNLGLSQLAGRPLEVPNTLQLVTKHVYWTGFLRLYDIPIDEELPTDEIPSEFVEAYLAAERWWEHPSVPTVAVSNPVLQEWSKCFAATLMGVRVLLFCDLNQLNVWQNLMSPEAKMEEQDVSSSGIRELWNVSYPTHICSDLADIEQGNTGCQSRSLTDADITREGNSECSQASPTH